MLALVAYLSLFHGTFEHIADDPGLGWHLANGSVIAKTGVLPRIDPFLALPLVANSYSPPGVPRPWINEQWFGDLVLYELLSLGGWPLIYGLVAGLYLVAYFGIAADSLRRPGEGWLLVVMGIVLAFKLGQVHLIIRPVLFSIVFFSLFVARCLKLAAHTERSWSEVLLDALVLGGVTVVWANTHPAFVYGFVVLGVVIASLVIAGANARAKSVKVAVILIVCLIASSFNPFGFHLYESMWSLGGSSSLRAITTEWLPVDFKQAEGRLLVLLALIPFVGCLVSSRIRRGVGIFEIMLALVFVLQAVLAVRVVPFASLACLPLWGACFGGKRILPELSWTALTRRALQRVDERELGMRWPGLKSSVGIAVVGLIVMLLVPSRVLPPNLGPIHERRLQEMFPAQAPSGRRVILASPDWGGAITRLMWPERRAVLDDRTVVLGADLYRAYLQSVRDPQVFEHLVRVFGVTDVLVPTGSPLGRYLQDGNAWRRVGRSGDTSLFSAP